LRFTNYPAGAILITASLLLCLFTPLSARSSFDSIDAIPHAGDLDLSFGDGGKVFTTFGPYEFSGGWANRITVQPDLKIVAVGGQFTRYSNSRYEDLRFILARYNPGGALDASFGSGGKVTNDFGSRGCFANTVAIQADGKILAAGESQGLTSSGKYTIFPALARYNADGTPDASFGDEGKVIFIGGFSHPPEVEGQAYAIALQSDGKIVIAGGELVTTQLSIRGIDPPVDPPAPRVFGTYFLTRLNADGSIDTSFGDRGIARLPDAGVAFDVFVLIDGRIVVICRSTDSKTLVVRYMENGSLDPSFGTDGIARVLGLFSARAGIVQPDGKIVVIGAAHNDYALLRLDADGGSPDTSFGSNGIVTIDFSTTNLHDIPEAVALQPDGKIIVAGSTGDFSVISDFAIARYNSDGSLDTTFGVGGKVSVNFGVSDYIRAVTLQPDGNVLAAGFTIADPDIVGPRRIVIARFLGSTPPPIIVAAIKKGKKLKISGQNFEEGARILLNGEIQQTIYVSSTILTGKKAGKFVSAGDKIQVGNPNGVTSSEFTYIP